MSPVRNKICEKQRLPFIHLTNKRSHEEILSKKKKNKKKRPAAREMPEFIFKILEDTFQKK